jgi:hypothetical protein
MKTGVWDVQLVVGHEGAERVAPARVGSGFAERRAIPF